jgi:dinuclear metal center YbgI/SA1388 family protein
MASAVSDIIHVLDNLAPPALAEEWDNIGLQVGDPSWPVRHIWIALDPTLEVVDAACRRNVDLLITHHPLIFKPLKSIIFHTPLGKIIDLATRNHLAIFAAHTNLDSAIGGVNDILADRIGIQGLQPLVKAGVHARYTIVIYATYSTEQKISRFLSQTRSKIERQDTWQASYSTKNRPIVMPVKEISGDKKKGSVKATEHVRIEIEVFNGELEYFIEALAEFQAEEQIWYAVYPLVSRDLRPGVGRIGRLEPAMDLKSLALMIKEKLGLEFLRLAGDPALMVEQAAVCTGSGSSLLGNFFKSGAQAYISGDLRYHDARDAQAASLGIIDIGHFPSEYLIVDALAERLNAWLLQSGLDIAVDTCGLERDPFMVL